MHSGQDLGASQSILDQKGRLGRERTQGSEVIMSSARLGDLLGLNCWSRAIGEKNRGVEHYDEVKCIPIKRFSETQSRGFVVWADLPFLLS